MQMHKKPLHGHVQAYQLEVKIVLIYSLRERWEVAHKLGFDERSWDWLKLSEENKTSDLSEIGKYSKSIYSDAFNSKDSLQKVAEVVFLFICDNYHFKTLGSIKKEQIKKKTILQNHHSNLSFFACQRIFQACKKHSKKDCLATKQRETISAYFVYFLIWYSVQYRYIGDKYKLYAKLLH